MFCAFLLSREQIRNIVILFQGGRFNHFECKISKQLVFFFPSFFLFVFYEKKNVYHPAMNLQKDENDKFKEINTIKKTNIFAMFVDFY